VDLDVDLDVGPNAHLAVPTARTGSGRLPLAVDVAAYRIVQESLTNVMKHAGGAARARVAVRLDGSTLDIDVTDDGRGPVAPGGPSGQTGGHGIDGMRERAATIGGTLEVGRRPGGGFRVHARLPARATAGTVAP
jgi:signal transduction histidine kinase